MIEIFEYTEPWFQPVFFSDTWQIALLNHAPQQELEQLTKLDIHLKTDEVFILHKGRVALITAEIDEKPYIYHIEIMEEGKVYNIPKNVWHNIAMRPDSSVYIAENKNTHEFDYKFHNLDAMEKKAMNQAVQSCWSVS